MGGGGAEEREERLGVFGERAMAGMDYVEIAAQGFGVDDFDGGEFAFVEFVGDGDLREEAEAELAFDHALGGFDGFHFEDDVGEEAGAAEEALAKCPIARAAIEEDERPGFDFFEAGLRFGGVGVAGMADEDQRVVAEGHGFDFGMIEGAGDADVGIAVEDHFEDLSGIAGADGDHRFGIGGLIVLNHVGEEIRADGEGCGDIERAAGRWLEFVNGLAREGDNAEELLGMRAEGFAGGREGKAGAFAVEENDTERVFEGVDAGADGGLADAEGFRGAVETTIGDDGEEGFDLVDFHESPPKRCMHEEAAAQGAEFQDDCTVTDRENLSG